MRRISAVGDQIVEECRELESLGIPELFFSVCRKQDPRGASSLSRKVGAAGD